MNALYLFLRFTHYWLNMCLSVTVLGLKLAKALNKYNMLFANDAILVIKIFSSDIISSIKKDISQFS